MIKLAKKREKYVKNDKNDKLNKIYCKKYLDCV